MLQILINVWMNFQTKKKYALVNCLKTLLKKQIIVSLNRILWSLKKTKLIASDQKWRSDTIKVIVWKIFVLRYKWAEQFSCMSKTEEKNIWFKKDFTVFVY